MTIAVSDFRVTNIETTLRYMGDQPITTPTLYTMKEGGRQMLRSQFNRQRLHERLQHCIQNATDIKLTHY